MSIRGVKGRARCKILHLRGIRGIHGDILWKVGSLVVRAWIAARGGSLGGFLEALFDKLRVFAALREGGGWG